MTDRGAIRFTDNDDGDDSGKPLLEVAYSGGTGVIEQTANGDEQQQAPRLASASYTTLPYLVLMVLGMRIAFITRQTYDAMTPLLRRLADRCMVAEKCD